MVAVIVVAALGVLALVTQAGVWLASARIPPRADGRGRGGEPPCRPYRAPPSVGPPIVMLHGASSNLEVMRQPLGERLAQARRVILIDRPRHGWSTRDRL